METVPANEVTSMYRIAPSQVGSSKEVLSALGLGTHTAAVESADNDRPFAVVAVPGFPLP